MKDLSQFNVKVVHPYIKNRLNEFDYGLYPKQHYWGADIFFKNTKNKSLFSQISNFNIPSWIDKIINRLIFDGRTSISQEIDFFHMSNYCDFVYSVSGPSSFLFNTKKTKVFSWVFSEPPSNSSYFSPYNKRNLSKHSGFLCLTKKAEKFFSHFAPSKFIPWCVDMELFDGKPSEEKAHKPFFLANGKTGRDYNTLIEAAHGTKADIKIIGPENQRPVNPPSNVHWINTSCSPSDQAIDYPTLKKWYAQSSGICIPLSGNADDTCGYTNMLEAMAMRKPILMTRSGCLDIDPESRNFGLLIEPHDPHAWTTSMNRIIDNKSFANSCGETGRKIVEREFTIDRFNKDVESFILGELKKSQNL